MAEREEVLLTGFDEARHPYYPNYWLDRAKCHLSNDYPDLAVGDAYKALLLCENILNSRKPRRGLGAWAGYYMHEDEDAVEKLNSLATNEPCRKRIEIYLQHSYIYLIDGLLALKCCSDAFNIYIRAIQAFPQLSQKHYLAKLQRLSLRNPGSYIPKRYPYMKHHHMSRSDELIEKIQQEFDTNLASADTNNPKCRLGRCALNGEIDALGIFANTDISNGDIILIDFTSTGASVGSLTDRCFNCYGFLPLLPDGVQAANKVSFCSQFCRDISIKTKEDFTWLQNAAADDHDAFSCIPLQRLLAACTEDLSVHPLDHPLVARLSAQYNNPKPIRFTLLGNIEYPIRILRQLGIDVFADDRYDTWVLQTIQSRMANNGWEWEAPSKPGNENTTSARMERPVEPLKFRGVNPLFSFFNHSCEPNVGWMTLGRDSTTLKVKAYRDIQKGEEFFVSYGNFQDKTVQERQGLLETWFSGPCQCKKCQADINLTPVDMLNKA